jgi:hypothetical protein
LRKPTFLLAAAAAATLAFLPTLTVSAAPESPGPGGVTNSALLAVIASVGDDVFSTTDLTGVLDPTGSRATQHYGPYASVSPDSGTCGNNWADDTFDRHFTVQTNPDGTFTVIQQFKNGSFMTPSTTTPNTNESPGACQSSTGVYDGGIVNPNVTGSMHGYFIIPLPPTEAQTSHSPSCDAVTPTSPDCTTTIFINTHFTPCYNGTFAATCSASTFFDHYVAPAQGLIENEWKNASSDRGGNLGDIRSATI